jgi:hypothetical protein
VVLSVVTLTLGDRADDPVWETALLSRPGLTAQGVRGGSRARKRKTHGQRRMTPPVVEPDAAGIDVGATEIYVAVPSDRDAEPSGSRFLHHLRRLPLGLELS